MLKGAGLVPEVVYIDANHHYDAVFKDISVCLQLFPRAKIVGDDWDYPDVCRAVREVGQNAVARMRMRMRMLA